MSENHKETCQEQLEQLRKEFDEFSYIVSHDLKAPVRAIHNLSLWIEEDLGNTVSDDVKQNMDLLRNRTDRLNLMIEALLTYSRVSTKELGKVETNVEELVEATKKKAIAKDAIVQVLNPLPILVTYKANLRYIITQLLQNAVNFGTSETLTVMICVTNEADCYSFEFADNGGGIPDEALDKIFKLFYTVAPKDTVDTTGAGLTIARKMVHIAGGEMWARNNEQGGLSILFTLPK